MDNKKVGSFIYELRKKKGLTQKELASKLNVSEKIISKWEQGLALPDVTILTPLSKALDADVSEILNGKYNENNTGGKSCNFQNKKILISVLMLVIICLSLLPIIKKHKEYYPNVINEGENKYQFDNYNFSKNGLDGLIDIINKSRNNDEKYNISYFEFTINKEGFIKKFTLTVNVFNNDKEYIGQAGYTYKDKKLIYSVSNNDNLSLVEKYSQNSDIEYINELIKKIPLTKQLELSGLKSYVIQYNPNTIIESGIPIFDSTSNQELKALSKQDYNDGKGGISDGLGGITIRLYDGTSIVSGQQYLYVFAKKDNDISTNSNYMMETDYYINNNTLKFTRNYGISWINTDITKKELEETLNYYNDISLKTNSWFLSKDKNIPIAYFYGEEPILKVSTDNGITWNKIELSNSKEMGRPIITRIVGFSSKTDGFVALGTDWSMGSGETKKIYFTSDAGKTWSEVEPPLNHTNNTLIDFCMYDNSNGVILLNDPDDANFPLMYATNDGGKNWKEVKLSYFNLPDEITYLVEIDTITKENDKYIIKMGQGKYGTLKAIFKVNDLYSPWQFVKTTHENIHTVG